MSSPTPEPGEAENPFAPVPYEPRPAGGDEPSLPIGQGGDDPRDRLDDVAEAGPAGDLPSAPSIAVEPVALPPRTGWRLVTLIAGDGKEPPAGLADDLAESTWCAVSALWHPSLLARAAELPAIEPVEAPSAAGPREIRVLPKGIWERLPSGYETGALDAGTLLLEAGADRAALVHQIQEHLGSVGTVETSLDPTMVALADDFLALGATRWLVRDLAAVMGYLDAINHQALSREVLAGADAWQACDCSTAVNRLRAGFEVLTQARERFYPVDAYLVDLCLLDPASPAGCLKSTLDPRLAITFVAPAQAIETQANQDPDGIEQLRQAIREGWVDVAGGPAAEVEDLVLPLESILWQFRRGGEMYRAALDERNVVTYARRRFGLYCQLPQIAKRFGFRFALHLGFDAGRFPVRPDVKRLWESPDGSTIETLFRPPLAADHPAQGLFIAFRLAATMRKDHVATLPLLHWPSPVATWYRDLRRGASYSPVLGRWVTLGDYFHLTDRPYEAFRPDHDAYVSPYLAQAAARRDPEPISRLARHHRLRARFESVQTMRALARSIAAAGSAFSKGAEPPDQMAPEDDAIVSVENSIETAAHAQAAAALEPLEERWAGELARGILGARSSAEPASQPGYLVINPLGIPRRVAVILPGAAPDLRPEGALRAAQFTELGVLGVVDLPAFGFAWVAAESGPESPAALTGCLSARGRMLKNESIELKIDETTGGIRGVMAVGETSGRLGQQLVVVNPGLAEGGPGGTSMRAERFEIDLAGPALVQATASGNLIDPATAATLGRFSQRYRLWTGRPVLEIDIALEEIDPAWLARAQRSDPWTCYVACRWAWPDPSAMLRRTVLLASVVTELARPETPYALDLSTRRQRAALLCGGLPYHQKHGSRMLDTLLLAGAETGREFRLGVVLDLEHPYQAALDLITPAPVLPTSEGPPASGARGWLLHLDHKAVAVTHVGFVESTGEGRGWGLVLNLIETAGQSARCRIRFFRDPTWARQVDFQGELIVDLPIDRDAVLVDLTPSELARLEVTLA
jgi:alpha-mannosidase